MNYNISMILLMFPGLWTAIPYGTMWLVSLAISWLSDTVIKRGLVRTVVVRKVANTAAHIGAAVCLSLIIIVVDNEDLRMNFTLAMFTVGVGCMGALYSSWIINPQAGLSDLMLKSLIWVFEREIGIKMGNCCRILLPTWRARCWG